MSVDAKSPDATPPDGAPAQGPRRRLVLGGFALAIVAVVVAAVAIIFAERNDHPTRQEVVARRGSKIMPFGLNATTHQFDTNSTGAFETVTANNADDSEQTDLIRSHLRNEAIRIQQEDFGDPAAIHGHDMPGLEALTRSAGQIDVDYSDVPAGARITLTTRNPELRAALAEWVMAQNTDHGTGMNHG